MVRLFVARLRFNQRIYRPSLEEILNGETRYLDVGWDIAAGTEVVSFCAKLSRRRTDALSRLWKLTLAAMLRENWERRLEGVSRYMWR